MIRRAILWFIPFFWILIAPGTGTAANHPLWALRSYVETTRNIVTLKDLLINQKALSAFDASMQAQPVLRLGNRKDVRYSPQEIYRSLRALPLREGAFPFRIPRSGIRIKRVYRVDRDRIARVFQETIRLQFGKIGTIRIQDLRLLGDVLLPSPSYRIVPIPPPRLQRMMRLKLKIKGDTWERTLFARARVSITNKVLIARKTIRRGEPLDADNTALVEEDTTCLHIPYVSALRQCQGQVAKRTIPAGRIITRNALTAPVLIRRGEVVTVKVQTPNILITTLAIAKQEGKFGDIIRVENIQSKKTIYAKVASKHLVTVEF